MIRLFRLAAYAAVAGVAAMAQVQAQENAVKIGVLTDMSSLYADLSGPGAVAAVKMAVADFGGSVLGKKIEIISADHQNKPDVASAIARQWFDQGVDMITDLTTSSVALAVQEVAREKHKVILINGAASSDLTGKNCAPTSVHWTYDTTALANGTGSAVVKAGGKTWFFITADYAFGHALVPLNTADVSAFLLQAKSSKAQIIGLANAGGDTINSIKQAAEFSIVAGGQKLAGLLIFLTDVHSLGLKTAQGLQLTSAFYWDQNDETRAWSKRFSAEMHKEPTMVQAGDYSATLSWLKAVKAANSLDAAAVMEQLRSHPISDFMTKNGHIQPDGSLVREMYLFEVKKPSESNGEWDLYKPVGTIPGDVAYRRPGGNVCPLAKG